MIFSLLPSTPADLGATSLPSGDLLTHMWRSRIAIQNVEKRCTRLASNTKTPTTTVLFARRRQRHTTRRNSGASSILDRAHVLTQLHRHLLGENTIRCYTYLVVLNLSACYRAAARNRANQYNRTREARISTIRSRFVFIAYTIASIILKFAVCLHSHDDTIEPRCDHPGPVVRLPVCAWEAEVI